MLRGYIYKIKIPPSVDSKNNWKKIVYFFNSLITRDDNPIIGISPSSSHSKNAQIHFQSERQLNEDEKKEILEKLKKEIKYTNPKLKLFLFTFIPIIFILAIFISALLLVIFPPAGIAGAIGIGGTLSMALGFGSVSTILYPLFIALGLSTISFFAYLPVGYILKNIIELFIKPKKSEFNISDVYENPILDYIPKEKKQQSTNSPIYFCKATYPYYKNLYNKSTFHINEIDTDSVSVSEDETNQPEINGPSPGNKNINMTNSKSTISSSDSNFINSEEKEASNKKP
ncbi:MAG: hypothetical protein LEGION0398_MBIBDBAK_00527 [Legionellaceae bacterium]